MVTNIDAFKLRKLLVSLWSPLLVSERDLHVDIGDLKWYSDEAAGLCLCEKDSNNTWHDYSDDRGSILENICPRLVIIVVPRNQKNSLGRTFLHTAIHEFAHVVRLSMQEIYYIPTKHDLRDTLASTKFAFECNNPNSTKSDMRTIEKFINVCSFELHGQREYDLLDYDGAIFPPAESGAEPLLGQYSLTWLQYDVYHDPLFYLINYLLERKAEDAGLFNKSYSPIVSVTF